MSDKFEAEPDRADAAVASLHDLANLILGFHDKFVDGLSGAPKILGNDDFGRAATQELQEQGTVPIGGSILAFGQVADAIPIKVEADKKQVGRAKADASNLIHEVGGSQGEGVSD